MSQLARDWPEDWPERIETGNVPLRGLPPAAPTSTSTELIPVDLSLPQTVEATYPFRIRVGQALNRLMDLKSRADGVIAEDMGNRRERVVDGVTYEYSGPSEWHITDPAGLLVLLNQLEAAGDITAEDYAEAVSITPQPDLVKFDNRKLNALVAKRGLSVIDAYRERAEGKRTLKVKR